MKAKWSPPYVSASKRWLTIDGSLYAKISLLNENIKKWKILLFPNSQVNSK